MSRRLSSCPRRWSATASIASSVTAAADVLAAGGADSCPSGAVADVLALHAPACPARRAGGAAQEDIGQSFALTRRLPR